MRQIIWLRNNQKLKTQKYYKITREVIEGFKRTLSLSRSLN